MVYTHSLSPVYADNRWDYGYQIAGMADRTTLVDNNTWNNTHIAVPPLTLFATDVRLWEKQCQVEEVSYPILLKHDVDYVLVIFGGLIGSNSRDDINKVPPPHNLPPPLIPVSLDGPYR